MEYTHTHTHKYTQEQSLNNPTKINYNGLTWQIKEIKKLYLPVKNKTNQRSNWKAKLKQGAKWGIKQGKQS